MSEESTTPDRQEQNVERIRGVVFENFLADRSDALTELLAPDVEWDVTDAGLVVRWKFYRHQAEARKAVGLAE